MNENISFSIAKTILEIENIQNSWIQWQHYPNSDIDFFLSIINARKETTIPFVITINSGQAPKAIAVARREDSYIPVKFGYKTLFKLKVKVIVIVYDGLLGEGTPQICQSIISALKEAFKLKEADMVRFELIDINSDIADSIQKAINPFFRERFITPQSHWKMSIPKNIDRLYSKLSKYHRNKLRKVVKKLENDFSGTSIQIQCFKSIAELETLLLDVETIAKKTYQRGLGAGFINNEENKSRLKLEAAKDWLRMYVLYLNGSPCAYWWTLDYNKTLYSCAMGYDPEYYNYSPGTYLMMKVFETLSQQDMTELDFGSGDALYKQQFGDYSYNEASINIFAPTLKGLCLNFTLSINNLITLAAKYILSYFQGKDIVKKYWRSRLKLMNR